MTKTFLVEELDCAVCAAKMEEGVRKIKGVKSATLVYVTAHLTVEADEADFPAIEKQLLKVCRRVEPDCNLKAL